jgi:two-component system probable response regulator PhcQ
VDLLGQVRQSRPGIIRILTTAYSDLDSAIEAVNTGAIFRYVTKPWNVRDLRGLLLRAMDFFTVQRERDLLLREKLSVLQRVLVADRVRSLAVLAAGLAHHIRNSMVALTTFLDLAPARLSPEKPEYSMLTSPKFIQDVWALAHMESQRILQIVQDVVDQTVEPFPAYVGFVGVKDLLRRALESGAIPERAGSLRVDVPEGLSPLKVDPSLAPRLFRILLNRVCRLSGPASDVDVSVREIQVWGTPGLSVRITAQGPAWTDRQIASLFTVFTPSVDDPSDLGTDLLTAFFIAHHHGGELLVHGGPPDGPGFDVQLPYDPEAVRRPTMDEDYMEKLFTHFERWEELQTGA